MEPGQKLKRARERLGLRYRDVEDASIQIAERYRNDEFVMALSRLSDIENKRVVPTIYRLYSLCAIYRLNLIDVLCWYGVDAAALPGDASRITIQGTHLIGLDPAFHGEVQVPISLDPGLDIRRTTYLSRFIQRWGKLPLSLLNGYDPQNLRYGFIGSEDWSMYPLLPPRSLVLIDENERKIANSGWANEFERPIYFFEHRQGYACGWCAVDEARARLVLQPHPASMCFPQVFAYPEEIEVIGLVTGVVMSLDQGKQRRSHV